MGLLKGKLFPANDDHRRRFNELTADFYQRLNPSEVLPYLIQKAVISSEEAAEIRNVQTYKSRSDAVLAFLFILPNRQRFWYDWMIWSLVKSNQVELAEKIDPVLTKGRYLCISLIFMTYVTRTPVFGGVRPSKVQTDLLSYREP